HVTNSIVILNESSHIFIEVCGLVAAKASGEHISLSTLHNLAHNLLIILGLIGSHLISHEACSAVNNILFFYLADGCETCHIEQQGWDILNLQHIQPLIDTERASMWLSCALQRYIDLPRELNAWVSQISYAQLHKRIIEGAKIC
ncbi:hypothetical protein ACJX0J_035274, partial [Zea mays]